MKKIIFVSILIIFSFLPQTVNAKGNVIPPKVQANLIFNILNYEKNIKTRCKSEIVYGVFYKSQEDLADKLYQRLNKKSGKQVAKLNFKVLKIQYSDIKDLKSKIESNKVNNAYFVETDESNLTDLSNYLSSNSILSFGSKIGDVEKALSVGFDYVQNKLQVVVNMKQTKKESAKFSIKFLKFAKILQ